MLKFDELNTILDAYREEYTPIEVYTETEKKIAQTEDMDAVVEILIMAYVFGARDGMAQLRISKDIDQDKLIDAIDKKIAGENWRTRIENGSDPTVIAETESIRCYNQAVIDIAEDLEGVYKTWKTMGDEKVRDTHRFLQDVKVPITEYFYTYDGDSAQFPCEFTLAENNVNCRCRIELSEGTEQTQTEKTDNGQGEGTP